MLTFSPHLCILIIQVLLKSRYGNTQNLAAAHFAALDLLPICTDDTFSLRHTYTQREIHQRTLEGLGKPVDSEYLLKTLLKKFPNNRIK